MGLSLLELAVDKRLPMVEVNLDFWNSQLSQSSRSSCETQEAFIQASKKIETSFGYLEEVPSF